MWHLTVDQALRITGFYHILRIGEIRENDTLLAALVTVTIEDVEHIWMLHLSLLVNIKHTLNTCFVTIGIISNCIKPPNTIIGLL
ncbi:hypothetical protein AHAS_Ahas11G0245100 [Arachis hypogaea]